MCLDLIVRFGSINNGEGYDGYNVMQSIKNILAAANNAAFKKLSSEALSERCNNILAAVQKMRPLIPRNKPCQDAIRSMESIVQLKINCRDINLNLPSCKSCSKSLSSKDVMRCVKCKTV